MTAKTMAARTVMSAQCRVRRRLPDADRFDAVSPSAVQVTDVAADFSGAAVLVVAGEYAHFGGAHAEIMSAIVDVLVEARARLGPALAPHDCADAIPATPSHTTLRRKTTGRVSMRRILAQSVIRQNVVRTSSAMFGQSKSNVESHSRALSMIGICRRERWQTQLTRGARFQGCTARSGYAAWRSSSSLA